MQRGCAVRGGRMSEPEEVVFMDVELTVTPIIVLGDGDRIIYKNAAAKKLLPFCRKGTTINRYLSYTGESRYLELVRQSEGCAIIELSESLGRCYRALTVRRDGVVVMTFLPILQGGAKDVLAEYAETLSFAASDGIMDFVLRSSDFVDRPVPAAAWNYTRRNTTLYEFSREICTGSSCMSLPLSSTLKRITESLSARLALLSLRFRITMRGSAVQLTPITDIAAFVYAFIPTALMICEASGGACCADIECYGETAGVKISGNVGNFVLPDDVSTLAELGELLGGNVPMLIIGDAAIISAGADLRMTQSGSDFAVEMIFPMKSVIPSHLFSPEEEQSLTERFFASIESTIGMIGAEAEIPGRGE